MPTLVGNPQRRTHRKSKLGCSNCKQRHVRCDELRPKCTYCLNHNLICHRPTLNTLPTRLSARPNLRAACDIDLNLPETSLAAFANERDLSPLRHCLDTHGLPVEWSCVESRLMYGFVQVCIRMQHAEGHRLSLGTSILPVLVDSAFHQSYSRFAILSMLTSQLAYVQKSSQYQLLTIYYRGRAFAALAAALNDFSQDNADAVLVTSVNLAYTSCNEREHKYLESGVSTIITKMQPYKEQSSLPQYFRGPYSLVYPPGLETQVMPCKPTALTMDVSYAILSGLEKTKALFGGQKAFEVATQNLWHVVYNVSDGRIRSGIREHFVTQDQLRPLKFLGLEFLADMGRASPVELLLMSYQELIMLIVQELRPETSPAYFILAKADVVVCIHDRLMRQLAVNNTALDSEFYMSIIEVPYKIATTYQRCGRIALA